MLFSKPAISGTLIALASIVSQASAHGTVTGLVIDGEYYGGFLEDTYTYMADPPATVGWAEFQQDNGFVADINGPDVICAKNAKPALLSAPVVAGQNVTLQWTEWPDSHHGPVIDYLAKCPGNCSDVDKTSLEFFKIDATGLINEEPSSPGTWASDQLIANNNSWTLTIPSNIEPGNYVLRHEIIALHSANNAGGAQLYPQCVNLEISGGGSLAPTGESAEKFYTATDPGILVNIYQDLTSYDIPGPAVAADLEFNGAGSGAGAGTPPASTSIPVIGSNSTIAPTSMATATSSFSSSSPSSSSSSAMSTAPITTAIAVPTTTTTTSTSPTDPVSTIPTEVPTTSAAIPTTTTSSPTSPTSGTGSGSPGSGGSPISTSGMSVQELLALLKQILLQLLGSLDSVATTATKARRHARDIRA